MAFISPELEDRGFRYVGSRFTYKRKSGDFTQSIAITLSHYNTKDNIKFWSAFDVDSPAYNKWLKRQGRESCDGHLWGRMDWNIPGWRAPDDYATSFDVSYPVSREPVLSDWLERCFLNGLPYLERISTWEGAADDLLQWRCGWQHAADFYLIAEKSEQAIAALQQGIEALGAQNFSYSEKAHPILVAKKERQAAERDAEVAAYRSRIETIGKD